MFRPMPNRWMLRSLQEPESSSLRFTILDWSTGSKAQSVGGPVGISWRRRIPVGFEHCWG